MRNQPSPLPIVTKSFEQYRVDRDLIWNGGFIIIIKFKKKNNNILYTLKYESIFKFL